MKSGFILYKDTKPMVDLLTNEQAGILLKSVFEYQESGVESCCDSWANLVFCSMVTHFKRDSVKWQESKDKRVAAGKTGGLAKASNAKQCQAKPSKSKQCNKSVAVTVTGTVTDVYNIHADFLKRFNEATGKNFRVMSDSVCGQLNARIKDGFTVDEIIDAAKNCSQDDYHKENPKYLTPEFILRSDKLQTYLNVKSTIKPTIKDWVYHGPGFGGSNVNKENQTFDQFCKLHKIGVYAE